MAKALARSCRRRALANARRALAFVLVLGGLLWSPVTAGAAFDASRYRAEVAQRRDYVIKHYGQAASVRPHAKWYPYFVLARTKLHGCDPKLTEYMARVLEQVEPSTGEPELFAEPPLSRFVYRHADCLTPAQRDRIAGAIERPRDLFGHGTINHAAMRSTSVYLLAQAFPASLWTDRSGRRYGQSELMARLKA